MNLETLTLDRSDGVATITLDRPEKHKRILESLGLHRNQTSRIHEDSPVIRGMVAKIPHLVEIIEERG